MIQTIKGLEFKKDDNLWRAEKKIYSGLLDFEVYTEEINIDLIVRILNRMDTDMKRIFDESVSVLTPVVNCFFGNQNNIKFVCNGITIGLNQDFYFVDFRICYHLNADDNFSDFANWMIDVKDFRIVGCRREQC